ncbi:pyridoxamine 5'-phosphate oxidase family protein [Pontimicrobium sp. SW4]|uniref:Pyridoxamine 5'-phosphate oxidase family protein n=1 Tax=Pontimicrobium sp. SW4 TaxID=3153519 RepID=A0AAU7BX29_9FLAO
MEIQNIDKLRELYEKPKGRAKVKSLPTLEKHSINFISKSPFLIISTSSKQYKMDASPRGGAPGFVKVIDNNTIIIPDAKGNNRVDSLSNITETGQIGLLFLISGVDETLRINGKALISSNKDYLNLFSSERKRPKVCLVVTVEEMFLHCAKALMRSKLWSEETKINRSELPSMGQMMKDQLNDDKPVESQEAMIERYQKDL